VDLFNAESVGHFARILHPYKEILFEFPQDNDAVMNVDFNENLPDAPIFYGHYWLKGLPILQAENICCLDYSVAKGGRLVAYRWDGEKTLDESKYCMLSKAKSYAPY
jgi:hypothetical protein